VSISPRQAAARSLKKEILKTHKCLAALLLLSSCFYFASAQSSSAAPKTTSTELSDLVNFSTTPVFDLSLGTTQFIRLTGNVTSSTVTNPVNGQVYTFVIEQDGTGGRSFVWPTQFQHAVPIDAFDGTANANTDAVQQFVYIKSVNKYLAVSSLIAN
jgi:hypothetical protein